MLFSCTGNDPSSLTGTKYVPLTIWLGVPEWGSSTLVQLPTGDPLTLHGPSPYRSVVPDLPAAWRPLYDGYDGRRGALWWEAVVLLRKAVLALVGTLLGSSEAGLPALTLVLLASLAVQEAVQPYENPQFNRGERLSSGGALLAALLATLYSETGPTTDRHNILVTAVIATTTALCLLVLVSQWARAVTSAPLSAAARAWGWIRLRCEGFCCSCSGLCCRRRVAIRLFSTSRFARAPDGSGWKRSAAPG